MHIIQRQVMEIRNRQQRQWMWNCASTGLLSGGVAGCAQGVMRLATAATYSWLWVAMTVFVPLLAGVFYAVFRARSVQAAATDIDRLCHLKDRTRTSLQFLNSAVGNAPEQELRRLQIEDTELHLQSLNPRLIAPVRAPRIWAFSVIIAAVAILLSLVSPSGREVVASDVQNPVVAEQASRVRDGMEQLEELQEETGDPELEVLLKEMNQHLCELSEPGVSPKEAMAKLSEMDQALQEMQKQLKDPLLEAQMQEIGEALSLAESMAAAGQAMSIGDLQKAAEELSKMDLPQLDRKTERAVTEKLEQAQKSPAKTDSSAEGKKDAVSESAEKMSKAIKSQDKAEFHEGAKSLAEQCKAVAQKKQVSEMLKKQTQSLAESKLQFEGELKNEAQGNRKGGNRAGKGSSGNAAGEKTAGKNAEKEMKLTGQDSGTGDVDTETSASSAQEQQAVREYRQNAAKYEAMAESALESESIPAGHRQTIRRYFEMIRPKTTETEPGTTP